MVTKEMLEKAYKYYTSRGRDLQNPKTIQEKLSWLAVYDVTPLKTTCADKLEVKNYVNEKIGTDICIPTIATYDKVEDINWNELPDSFVVKCNHGSGMNIIVRDKKVLNRAEATRKLSIWMKDDFAFRNGFELHYHDIPHKIIVEPLMGDEKQKDSLLDYKFWCFNGQVKLYTINGGHGHGDIIYYDLNDKEYNFYEVPNPPQFKRPEHFQKMLEYANILAEDFKFVRVDFYEINGKVYLGEMTFLPGAGQFRYKKKEYDLFVGGLLEL